MRARWYDPGTGQFLSVDPDDSQTGEPYSYADGNPVSQSDPSGDAPKPVVFSPANLCQVGVSLRTTQAVNPRLSDALQSLGGQAYSEALFLSSYFHINMSSPLCTVEVIQTEEGVGLRLLLLRGRPIQLMARSQHLTEAEQSTLFGDAKNAVEVSDVAALLEAEGSGDDSARDEYGTGGPEGGGGGPEGADG
jgi:uncharacterized protein RhaS with RHS repeats